MSDRLDAEIEMKLSKALVCAIPFNPSGIIGPAEFQKAFIPEKGQRKYNKGEMLRICFRTLSSIGYLSDMAKNYPEQYAIIREYQEDFDG